MHTCRADLHAEGLQDNCARCRELAEKPLELDPEMLEDLMTRTLANRFGAVRVGDDPPTPTAFGIGIAPRSQTEAVAMGALLTALEQTGRLLTAAGAPAVLYLLERWGLDIELAH